MDWHVVLAALALGAVALAVAALNDRARARRAAAAAAAPPERHVPGLAPDAASPAYVWDAEARAQPAPSAGVDLDRLRERLAGTTALRGGWADEAFVTEPGPGWAVVREPLVLACTGIGSFREVLPAVTAAKAAGRGLVVVAPDLAAEVVATLAANAARGHLPGVVVACGDMAQVAAAAAATGATIIRRADLLSGWLPTASLGGCGTWVSDRKRSWALADDRAETLDPDLTEPST